MVIYMKYEGYYDVHTHMLPGVDDGAGDMEETKKMMEQAYQQGVRHIFFTPHYISGQTKTTSQERQLLLEEVKTMAVKIAPDLDLYLGNEIYYSESSVLDLQKGKASTLCNSDYVLVEFSTKINYKNLYGGLRKLLESGYRPILAHVERYECLYKNPGLLEELTALGAYLQMNTESLIGGILDGYVSYCRRLVMEGNIHLLGSDSHDTKRRPPLMKDAIIPLEKKKINKTLLERILYRNPERMLQNKYI